MLAKVGYATAQRVIYRIVRILAFFACALLVVIMVLTVVDTSLRYLTNSPVSASNEVIEIMLSLLIMLAIPLCTVERDHIRVDLLDQALGRTGRFLADLLTHTIGAATLCFLGQRAWRKALDAQEFGDKTLLIDFPQSILFGVISASAFVFAALLIWQLFTPNMDIVP